MSIKIYTYANPYRIDDESFWDKIKQCPQFCVSQTMVNGMNKTYPHFAKTHQLCTIRNLVDALYNNWNDLNTKIRQMLEVGNVITQIDYIRDNPAQYRSMQFNSKSIAECIRIFSELGLDANTFRTERLNVDQIFLVEIYKRIKANSKTTFAFHRVSNPVSIDEAIVKVLTANNAEVDLKSLDMNTIVIHGIHQFSPAILCAIEDVAKFKDIILLFNYQSQYSKIYETWLNIYSLFNLPIVNGSSDNEFIPTSLYIDSFGSNQLADSIGKLFEGQVTNSTADLGNLEVIEFENTTEFANYVARIYEEAAIQSKKLGGKRSPLAFMKEQFYSASLKVNDILRAYFPDQFGERHFLDYPLGHFFVGTANLWNDDEKRVRVNDFADIKECLEAGIIAESHPGQLVNCLNKVIPYIENELYLDNMIKALRTLTKYVDPRQTVLSRIGYFNVRKEDVKALISALEELEKIIRMFFDDFNIGDGNFKRFYERVQKFIANNVDVGELDNEVREVVKKLLKKLEDSDLPEGGTFFMLKQTMSVYLQQDNSVASSARWIVRGFEQIDGDILLSAASRKKIEGVDKPSYHFCALSDKDICSSQNQKLPWPLEPHFFEVAQVPVDWKYQVFLKSKLEYNNFNRYALLYGLEFNRLPCKLSYIKNDGQSENELYSILSLLGVKVKKYIPYADSSYQERISVSEKKLDKVDVDKLFSNIDFIKAAICPYRFALESIVQGKTIFRDRFLIQIYMRVLIQNTTLEKVADTIADETKLKKIIADVFDEYLDKVKIADELERVQLLNSVMQYMSNKVKKNGRYWNINAATRNEMSLREDFLLTQEDTLTPIDSEALQKLFEDREFKCVHGKHCKYCACKDICLEYHHFVG